ncbi:alpha/beta hydrolase [Streptomyces sp. SID10815]|uniref:esterase/lipase family protein n=1 Tax=Streptomyces sp. SID10815 TaxID=2706027 RepID=UPI0013C6E704|nr:alpha/beta hydrolase [Streptomyces sp. SID10815]NEA46698.1 alpha/beta hydrolase [Streptomyces sp. SID10815]
MPEPTEREVTDAFKAAAPIALAATPPKEQVAPAPQPDDTWSLPGGTAWVYYGDRNQGLVRPVLMADGFNSGPSSLDDLWAGLENSAYPLISQLRRRGRDVVLIGYDERSASILDNAQTATAAILRAVAERLGDSRLMVGGFSMGGLVTRYALARMEMQRIDHQVGVYFSYDSPHNGAHIPISLQAFAHYIRKLDSRFSDQMNSPAARQLLWRHVENWSDKPDVSPLRTQFLDELDRVGGWPRIPRLLAVANGVGDGTGNDIQPGTTAVKGKGLGITGTDLRTTATGSDALAATLRVVTQQKNDVLTEGLPDIDGAPGGTLESFQILADALNKVIGLGVDNPVEEHCFVPAVSAVAIRGVETHEDLYTDIDSLAPDEAQVDDYFCAMQNERHTKVTEELCTWLLDRLPD